MKTYNDLKGTEKTVYDMKYDFCIEVKRMSHEDADKCALEHVESVYERANSQKGEQMINLRTGQRYYNQF